MYVTNEGEVNLEEQQTNYQQSFHNFCEAQARVRQGSARDDSQGERPQSLNPCLELTLKLVATFPPPTASLNTPH